MSIQDLNAIQDALYDWATSVVPTFSFVWADQNIPFANTSSGDPVSPVEPSFTLRIGTITKIHEDSLNLPTDASTLVDIEGTRDFILGLQGFGPGSIQQLENLRSSLSRPSIKDSLFISDIIVRDTSVPIINISGLDDSEMEERGSVDIGMRTDSVITNEDVGKILIVNAVGTYKKPDGSEIISNVNVTTT